MSCAYRARRWVFDRFWEEEEEEEEERDLTRRRLVRIDLRPVL